MFNMTAQLLFTVTCIASAVCSHVYDFSSGSSGGHDLGSHGIHEYDDGNFKLLKESHGGHGQSHHGGGGHYDEKKQSHHAHHDIGSQGSQIEKGGHKGNVKHYHDKGSYVREKKYGYEKAYGYEKEHKHHDKGGHAHSYGDSYNHQKHHANYKKGGEGADSHSIHKDHHHHGSSSHGHHGNLLNHQGGHKTGKVGHGSHDRYHHNDYKFGSGGGYKVGNNYSPINTLKYRSGLLKLYPRWKYFGGFRGLGGLGHYGLSGLNHELESELYDSGDLDIDSDLDDLESRSHLLPPPGITGVGGGLGPHGHYYYFVKHHTT